MTLAQQFMYLFAGLNRAYGTYKVHTVEASGKNTGKALTVRGEVTEALWQGHLDGKESVGIIPITDDCACVFGAVDIDAYKDFDPATMAVNSARLNLPLVVCRSKSGGAHCYLFATSPVPAGAMQDRLREILQVLGLPKRTEIFPKQRELGASDIGGWINMPYFDADKTVRYAYNTAGEQMLPEQFILLATEMRQDYSWFVEELRTTAPVTTNALSVIQDAWFPDGPPCLQQLGQEGIPEGMRNNALVQVGMYIKQAVGKGHWSEACSHRLQEINLGICEPPLEESELRETIIKTHLRTKLKRYACRKEPLESRCNAPACKGRRYGVGRSGSMGDQVTQAALKDRDEDEGEGGEPFPDDFPFIGQLRRVMSNPVRWILDVNDVPMELETDDLINPLRFSKLLVAHAKYMSHMPTSESWRKYVKDLLDNSIDVEVEEPDQFWQELEYFCRKFSANVPDRNAVRTNNVWTERGYMWFQLRAFMHHLRMHRLSAVHESQIQLLFKMRAFLQETWQIQGVDFYVWGVPEYPKLEAQQLKVQEGSVL